MEAVITKQKISYLFFTLSIILIALIDISAYRNSQKLLQSSEWLSHTYAVMNQITKIGFIIADAQVSRRGYVITNDPNFLGPYRFAVNNLDAELETLREMISDNPEQIANHQKLKPLVANELSRLKQSVEMQEQRRMNPEAQLQFMEDGRVLREGINKVLDSMRSQEVSLIDSRREQAELDSMYTTLAMILGTLLSFILLILGFVVLHRGSF